MKVTVEINEVDLEAQEIRDAMAVILRLEARTARPETPAETVEKKTRAKKEKPAEAAAPAVDRNDVLAGLKEIGAKHGAQAAKNLVLKYAGLLADVTPEDLVKLAADVKNYAPAAADDDMGI